MFSFITRYLRPEVEVVTGDELRQGPAIVQGFAEKPEEALRSPFRQVECIAYSYKAYSLVKTRGGQMPQEIKNALVYTTFLLRLEDGTEIKAVPVKPGAGITADEHSELQNSGINGFYVDEEPISWNRKVRMEGMVVQQGEQWVLRYRLLTDLGESAAAPSGAAPRLRKKKKRSRAAR